MLQVKEYCFKKYQAVSRLHTGFYFHVILFIYVTLKALFLHTNRFQFNHKSSLTSSVSLHCHTYFYYILTIVKIMKSKNFYQSKLSEKITFYIIHPVTDLHEINLHIRIPLVAFKHHKFCFKSVIAF